MTALDTIAQPTAEESVLGALLLDPACLARVRPLLPIATAFADPQHQAVYAAVLAVFDAKEPVDHITLSAKMRAAGHAESELLLAQLIDCAVTSANVEAHARLVFDAWRRRQAMAEADRLRKAANDPALNLSAVIAETCQRLVPIGTDQVAAQSRRLTSVLWEVMEDLEQGVRNQQAVRGIPTGLDALDDLTDGWQPGILTILAARPSRGKTSLGLLFALEAAKRGEPVDVVSIEMTEDELVARMFQSEIGRDLRQLRKDASLFNAYAPKLAQAAGMLSTLPIEIDCASKTVARIRLEQQAAMSRRGRPTGLLVIDYLGLMDADTPQQNRDRELGAITAGLKALAKDLRVAVLLLAQLNRSSDRESRPPELFDLRDSGNIEQDATDVMMLHWPEGKPDRGAVPVDLYLRKNRNGRTGKIPLLFEPWSQRWLAAPTA